MPRFLSSTPTVDKYFRWPMAREIAGALHGRRARPVRRLGPHLFATADHAVVLRHCTDGELRALKALRLPEENCYYLIDDSLPSMLADDSLPAAYRRRLRRLAEDVLPEVLGLCGNVVAPSRKIAAEYPGHRVLRLHPVMRRARTAFGHFREGGKFRMIFAGTASHRRDLDIIAPALAEFCARHDDVRLLTFMGKDAPSALPASGRVRHMRPLRWPLFRIFLERASFHVSLAPMRSTPVNRARSINKILDAASLGSVPLLSQGACPELDALASRSQAGVLLGDDPGEWLEQLEKLRAGRYLGRAAATKTAREAWKTGAPDAARDFWRREWRLA